MEETIIQKLTSFFSQYKKHTYKKGEVLIQARAQPSGVFYIEDGIVRRYWITENGEEITLNLYKPHSFLPMSWAIGNVSNSHFYEAMIPVTARLAPKEDVLAFLKREPDVVYDLLRRVYIGMEGLWMHLESLTAGHASGKLIASLIILAKRFGKAGEKDVVVNLKMSEQDIANYAGMSRETTSRELQKLKKDNLLSFEKGILSIHNLEALENHLNQ